MEKQNRESTNEILELAQIYWETMLSNDPLYATTLGDHRYDGKLPDITPMHRNEMISRYEQIAGELSKTRTPRDGSLEITRTALSEELHSQVDNLKSDLEDWTVDPLRGPQVEFMNIESIQPVRTRDEARAMLERWRAMAPLIENHIRNLSKGLEEGRVATIVCTQKVTEELTDLLAKPIDGWALMRPAMSSRTDWTSEQSARFRKELSEIVSDSIRPAFSHYLEYLAREILPVARPQERAGIKHIARGEEDYKRLVRVHTSLDISPDGLHQTGIEQVQKINREMEELGERVFGTRDREVLLKQLRSDKSLYFSSRDEVAEKAEQALARAKAAIPKWFGRLPEAGCEVVRMGEHEEKHSTIAYYRPGTADGSRPGRYYINTSEPETRPRYEAEALAYHESIPGHHLQIAIAQEQKDIPDFRRYSGVTAFVEGWGLYSERLSDEMDLYSSDLDRLGMLSYDAWRACRLVVDTGMHAKGWSRDQAIQFMWENSALAMNNIVNEVDRYITWPGQALAYKTGQLCMLRLRERAKERLGKRFDIKRFHDVLLGEGALPLSALERVVEGRLV